VLKNRIIRILPLIIISAATILSSRPKVAAQVSNEAALLPTEALHFIFQELVDQPTRQKEIAEKYLSRVSTTNLKSAEQFALGEVYFVALKPKESTEVYEKFISGHDMRARMAWQRVILMKIRAFEKVDEAEKEIYQYRKRFPADEKDLFHLAYPVSSLARYYADKGDHERVVKLISDEIESLPSNAPYYSFGMVATFFESFKNVGKEEAAIRMLERGRNIYSAAAAKNGKFSTETKPLQGKIRHRPGVLHSVGEGLLKDYPPSQQVDASFKTNYDRINTTLAKVKKTP
jgi:hypothetical protein